MVAPSLDPNARAEDRVERVVAVHIIRENLMNKKPFIGGFRNKLSGVLFHHACSQTLKLRKKVAVEKAERDSQTKTWNTRSMQTKRESGTQVERRDLVLDVSKDRVIEAKRYFTSEELHELKCQKAEDIQCFLRQCFAFRRVRRLKEAREEAELERVQEQARAAQAEAEDHQRQIDRRMHPRTPADFAILHKELEAWRLHETARIKSSGADPVTIHSQLADLLNKEVKLLQTIDRLKTAAGKENKENRIRETLEKMASPKEWETFGGDKVEVDTPFTTRAREMVELYNGLCLPDLPTQQRVDVLLHVKYTVKEFQCELTDDILEQIAREQDLLRRGRGASSLAGLRKRLSNLFLQFVESPQFNPEAANYLRVRCGT